MIRTILVEDSAENREFIRSLLVKYCPAVEIVGEAGTLAEAESLIEEKNPHVVLLDIQMQRGTSFDLLEKLYAQDKITFEIIFITAHGTFEYATKAIQYSALDYITKPVDPEKLQVAITRAEEKISARVDPARFALLFEHLRESLKPHQKRIAFQLPKGILEFIEVSQIQWLEADGQISWVHLDGGRKLAAMKHLGHYHDLLSSDFPFFRISDKYLLNIDFLKRYNPRESTITLSDGNILIASRRGGQELHRYLKSLHRGSGKRNLARRIWEDFGRMFGR